MPLPFLLKCSGKGDTYDMRFGRGEGGEGKEGRLRVLGTRPNAMGGSLRGRHMRILPTIRSSLGGSGDAREGQWVEVKGG